MHSIQHNASNMCSCTAASMMSKGCLLVRCIQATACECVMLSFIMDIVMTVPCYLPIH
jgi:hypothetical protein